MHPSLFLNWPIKSSSKGNTWFDWSAEFEIWCSRYRPFCVPGPACQSEQSVQAMCHWLLNFTISTRYPWKPQTKRQRDYYISPSCGIGFEVRGIKEHQKKKKNRPQLINTKNTLTRKYNKWKQHSELGMHFSFWHLKQYQVLLKHFKSVRSNQLCSPN